MIADVQVFRRRLVIKLSLISCGKYVTGESEKRKKNKKCKEKESIFHLQKEIAQKSIEAKEDDQLSLYSFN